MRTAWLRSTSETHEAVDIAPALTIASASVSVLPEGEIESSLDAERGWRCLRHGARYAMIAEASSSPEDKGVAGRERDRLHRVAATHASK